MVAEDPRYPPPASGSFGDRALAVGFSKGAMIAVLFVCAKLGGGGQIFTSLRRENGAKRDLREAAAVPGGPAPPSKSFELCDRTRMPARSFPGGDRLEIEAPYPLDLYATVPLRTPSACAAVGLRRVWRRGEIFLNMLTAASR